MSALLSPLVFCLGSSLAQASAQCLERRAIQCTGLLLGIVGFGLGFWISGGWAGLFTNHRNLGLAAAILGVVQLPALRWRPKLTSPRRRLFNQGHWWIGRAAVLVAVANVYYGLISVQDVSAGAWGGYTAVFSLIVGGAILKESYDYCQLPPPKYAAASQNDLFAPAGSGKGADDNVSTVTGLTGLDGDGRRTPADLEAPGGGAAAAEAEPEPGSGAKEVPLATFGQQQ